MPERDSDDTPFAVVSTSMFIARYSTLKLGLCESNHNSEE